MPQRFVERHNPAADLAVCRAILASGSRTFLAASRFLPRRVGEPAAALYAFCRIADDQIDVHGGRRPALQHLRERLDLAYAGRPLAQPLDRALATVIDQFGIPRVLPEALLEGLEWDAAKRRYDDLADLHAYAARVAGSVGAMMARLMGTRDPAVIACACDLGAAMQFSNIARDVGEDARAGQIYLPLRWLQEAGIEPDRWLLAPVASDALVSVIHRLLRVADGLYRRADAGIAKLPLDCRPGIYAARLLYAEIGREVERLGQDALSRRAFVPAWRKWLLLAQALGRTLPPQSPLPAPVAGAAQFLIEAAAAPALPTIRLASSGATAVAWWNLSERMVRVLELFEALERRDRLRCALGYPDPTIAKEDCFP